MQAGEGRRLRALRREALTVAPEAFGATVERDDARPDRFFEDLARGPGVVLVLGDWAGMTGIRLDGEEPWLWGMWVSPRHRGSGGGRALLDAAVDWARARGFRTLRLSVRADAAAARALYMSAGFEPASAREPGCEIGMALALDPPPRRLATERLVLRPFEAGDFDALHAMLSRADVVRWLYEDPAGEEETRERLRRGMERTRFALTGDGFGFALERDGEVVGDASLMLASAEHHQGELGFLVHPDHQGRGYASEAALALLGLAFGTFGLHRVVGRLEARNAASARVLERAGMRREAHLVENELVKGEWQSEVVYALLAADWRQSQPRLRK
jgi:RimJ/RimL family protein N-acetyltransferase